MLPGEGVGGRERAGKGRGRAVNKVMKWESEGGKAEGGQTMRGTGEQAKQGKGGKESRKRKGREGRTI